MVFSFQQGGTMRIFPAPIQAEDADTLQWPIRYSMVNSSFPAFKEYFYLDRKTGQFTQLKPLSRLLVKEIWVQLRAEQINPISTTDTNQDLSDNKFTLALLHIEVRPMNQKPPVLSTSSTVGYVYENSLIGSVVYADFQQKKPIVVRLFAEDELVDTIPDFTTQMFEIQLTSHLFAVSPSGQLIVAQSSLDRDPPSPSLYKVQLIARASNQSDSVATLSSLPITIEVHVLDQNDNWPRFNKMDFIQVPAGDTPRIITTVSLQIILN